MVQYAEIKEVKTLINSILNNIRMSNQKELTIQLLTKYKEILEGWYGDEQYHNKVEEGLEL